MSTSRPPRSPPAVVVFTPDPMPTASDPPPNVALETGGVLAAIKLLLEFIRDNQTSTAQKAQVTNFPTTQAVSAVEQLIAFNAAMLDVIEADIDPALLDCNLAPLAAD